MAAARKFRSRLPDLPPAGPDEEPGQAGPVRTSSPPELVLA
jgi:hypothetical protein